MRVSPLRQIIVMGFILDKLLMADQWALHLDYHVTCPAYLSLSVLFFFFSFPSFYHLKLSMKVVPPILASGG